MYFTRLIFLNFILICFLVFSSCTKNKKPNSKTDIGYDLKKPDKVYSLEEKLREISGISFFSDSIMALEEDEDASIFFLNLQSGELSKHIRFGKQGDYEDLAILGDTAYMLRNDGKLNEVFPLSGTEAEITVNKYETGLSKKNNTEGLCYDRKQNKFLIACKGSPNNELKYKNKKAIYAYDLITNTISTEPYILIDNNEVMKKADFGKAEMLVREFEAMDKTSDGTFSFQPSAIAIHPRTDEFYILSSVAKLLAVLNREGKVLFVFKLPASVFNQPEGITFDAKGNLFISNEGGKGQGNIFEIYVPKEMKIKFYSTIVFVFLFGFGVCIAQKPFYNKKESGWEKNNVIAEPVKYSVYLIGELGGALVIDDVVLTMLRSHIENADSNHTVIFLGDNINPNGLPPEGDSNRKQAEEKIDEQLKYFINDKGKILFIPGNRYWEKGEDDERENVLREEIYVETKLDKGNVFLPDDGCPGPVEVDLTENLVLIPLNTQSWLQPNRNEINMDCEIKNELDWVNGIKDILDNNQRKNLLVVGYHPIYNVGNHAGYFPIKEHIFPFTALHPALYLPLPVLGSIYPLYRSGIGSRQDFAHPDYKNERDNLLTAIEGYENLVYASGQEHNLQYFNKGTQHFIISGSGSQTAWVGRNNNASFTYAGKGFVKLSYLTNGEVWMEMYVPDSVKKNGEVVFRKKLKNRSFESKENDLEINSPINYSDSTITISADKEMKDGKLRQFFLGKHYRHAWVTPIKVPVLELTSEQGGLDIIKKGGGMQTKSLRMQNASGNQYTLRSITKYPDKLLPKALENTFASDVLRDQESSSHPYAALVVNELAESVGILHSNPKLVYIPDSKNLLEFRKDFANTLALFEQRAEGNLSEYQNFGNTKDAINSVKMFKSLNKDNSIVVDEYTLLKCRLFDMWIHDWDRHEDQWRWATVKCNKKNQDYCKSIKADDKYYVPIPRDRDQAFSKYDGLLPWLAGREWLGKKFQTFEDDIHDINGFNYNARFLDRALLTGLSKEEWMTVAGTLQQELTDERIEHAIKQWPENIFNLDGNEIISHLKARRSKLPSFVERYYSFLAEEVDVVGSNKKEIFEVIRLNNDSMSVKVYDNKNGLKGRLLYARYLKNDETKEVRLYGLGGEDIFTVSGKVNKGILVRIIGGNGNDSISDFSHVSGWSKKTKVYDDKNKNCLSLGTEAKDLTSSEKSINNYTRFSCQYDLLAPIPFLGYNVDDGVFLGGGVFIKHYGFRKVPYASTHKIIANVSIKNAAFNFKYAGDFTEVIGKWGIAVDATILAPNSITNFYGLGNDTKADSTVSDSYYHLGYEVINVYPALKRFLGKYQYLKIGLVYNNIKIENTPDRFITSEESQIYITDFSDRNYGGLKLEYEFKLTDNPVMPVRGIGFNMGVVSLRNFSNSSLHPYNLHSELKFYVPLPNHSTFAFQVQGAHLINDFEFFLANTLGGVNRDRSSGNLRGYLRGRYSGRSFLSFNYDLRIKLFDFRTYLFPAQFGVLGFYDDGKVWSDNLTSNTWHSSYGGGIWINPMESAVINMTYAISKEEKLFTLSLGFSF